MYAKAVQNAVANYELKNPTDEEITYEEIKDYIKYDGAEVDCYIKINNETGNVSLSSCKVGGERVSYTYGNDVFKSTSIGGGITTEPNQEGSTPNDSLLNLNITGNDILTISNLVYRTNEPLVAEGPFEYSFKVKNTGVNAAYLIALGFGSRECEVDDETTGRNKTLTCNKLKTTLTINGEEYSASSSINRTVQPGEILEIVFSLNYVGEGKSEFLNVTYEDFKFYFRTTNEIVTTPKIGDVDGDGFVTVLDADYLSKYANGWTLDSYAAAIYLQQVGDVTCDGSIDGTDSMLLSRYANGWSKDAYADAYIDVDSCPVN